MDYNQSSSEVLARYFDAFIEKVSGVLRDGVRDIETGAIRSLALISPQVSLGYANPQYINLISAHGNIIREEDSRILRSIFSLVKKPNVIYEMTLTIVNFVFATMPERTKTNLMERRKEIEDKVTDTIAKQAIKAAAKVALIEVLVQLITLRISSSPDVIISSRQVVARILTAFQIYSYFDKAAVAARALRRENRVIYNMLYSQEVEMLYFLLQKIDPLIKISLSNDSTNAEALMFALVDVFYKR